MGFWKYVLGTPRNYALTFNEEVIWLFLQLKIRKVEIVVQAINVV